MKLWPIPPDYSHVKMPEESKLPVLDAVPQIPNNVTPIKRERQLADIRGPELVHNRLLYKQYGIIVRKLFKMSYFNVKSAYFSAKALTGCHLYPGHINVIRNTINRALKPQRMFAVWRIDAPWKPVSKKGVGKRMGGGKGNIHCYVTPIRAGRVIVEVGGKCEFDDVRPFLQDVIYMLPCMALAVDENTIQEIEKNEREKRAKNINPLTFEEIYKKNIRGVQNWVSPYHFWWKGEFE
ncbi:39S ribosomal protein L16: mitochondrial-like isoform X1 [Dinothrombium tinctorium]|uniref:Large ribosomal subunit protein uL16m n=1 Tax=Dinothrombium tinctorium TaxID=1965070 RepID=A0A3S3RL72_9ACAR|nr:39S ribosomal protein L16: mitochondrial-like isoform X1 [Dinothrombium tinctorium]RWS02645.1 39S ribosomal protein L16: mitochondrial-like isoform X1 [Dinothrombium tinctorium]